MHFIMKPGRAGCTAALAHTQGHAGARAARTYHWSRENEMMKRMPAGSRAIYTWTSELWPRNQTLHKEVVILAPSLSLVSALAQAGNEAEMSCSARAPSSFLQRLRSLQ